MLKHPAAQAYDDWRASRPGRLAHEGEASGQYLENRLSLAFVAGWNALDQRVREALDKPTEAQE